ncbi:MAG: nucleoside-diphosphate sugar epimerase [Alphaproteobacteria bacterium]|nr:nucleoside-diphosphate sugar epimerase [Alphaproteobacteria bacterium]
MTKKSVWVIADDRAGNTSQSVGVAEALGMGYEVKNIRYNGFARLPNILRGVSLLGVDKASVKEWMPDGFGEFCEIPDVVISAGRRVAPFCRFLKRQFLPKKVIFVQLMHPGYGADDFDIVAVPNHDAKLYEKAHNVVRITGAAHKIFPEKLEAEKGKWQEKFAELPVPYTVVFVGGDTKKHEFTSDMAKDLTEYAELVRQAAGGGSVLITTSRRTSDEAVNSIASTVLEPNYLYCWGDEGENPYLGLLAVADNVVVSGDSVSMCSEVCSTGKPVFIYSPDKVMSNKHKRLHKELEGLGYAHIVRYMDGIDGEKGGLQVENININSPEGHLNASHKIAKKIKKKLKSLK